MGFQAVILVEKYGITVLEIPYIVFYNGHILKNCDFRRGERVELL
ncbi:hypothetical protein SDC9_179506 [bioreactor metagenome]|uniref:Uncharacterized protein n=1 Tax=bioreactor metagenome TaxID=1076179 RepID=A0A645H031_9ZZZZ